MATTERGLLHQMHSSQVYLREFRELNALKTRLSESDLVDEELQRQLPGCENMDAICKVFSRSIQGSEELLYLLNETAEFDSLAQTFGVEESQCLSEIFMHVLKVRCSLRYMSCAGFLVQASIDREICLKVYLKRLMKMQR